ALSAAIWLPQTLELKVHAASNTTGRPEPQSCTNSFVPSFAATSDVRMGDFCAAAGCEGTSAAPKTAGSRTVRRFMMLLPCRSFAASVAADGSIIAKEGRACDYATGHRCATSDAVQHKLWRLVFRGSAVARGVAGS